MAVKEAKVKKNLLVIDIKIPMLWQKGPVQHLMVIGTRTKIPFNPKLMKKAEMA